jgi:hypothetical protein
MIIKILGKAYELGIELLAVAIAYFVVGVGVVVFKYMVFILIGYKF